MTDAGVGDDAQQAVQHAVARTQDARKHQLLAVDHRALHGFERGLADLVVVVLGHGAEIDVVAEHVAALTGDVEEAACGGGDDGLGPDVGEVGVAEDVEDAPSMVADGAAVLGADRASHLGTCAVATQNVFCADLELFAARATEYDLDGVLTFADGQSDELHTPHRLTAGGGVLHELREVVEHPGLVADDVGVLGETDWIVGCPRCADDPARVFRVGAPVGEFVDLESLGHDLVGEPERFEHLDGTPLDAVGLPDNQPALTLLDQGA